MGTVTADVLDRDRVSPGNIVGRNAQDSGQALALQRAGGVVAADDGFDDFRVQARGGDELVDGEAGLFQVVGDGLHYGRNLITLRRQGRRGDLRMSRRPKRLDPIHPGEILREDFLKPMGISLNQLARDLDVPPTRIHGIAHGTRSVTADTALRLGIYFGVSPEIWLNLQADYDMRVVQRARGDRDCETGAKAGGGVRRVRKLRKTSRPGQTGRMVRSGKAER